MPAVPFKADAARRHRIPRQRHRVTNWAEYDAALKQRGSPTVWFSEEDLLAQPADPGLVEAGQAHRLRQLVHPPGRDAPDPRLLDHRHQGLLAGLARLEEGREVERPGPELGH